jgi:hypothetical protein
MDTKEEVFLRAKRNSLLIETDVWALTDRTMSQAQINYRQKLRDLPSTASPKLDENEQIIGVTWPVKPKE